MSRFWIILAIVIISLGGLFLYTKPDKDSGGLAFEGNAEQVLEHDHVKFKNDKKVVLIEYGDFQCPSCGSSYPVLKEVAEKYKDHVTFIYRHFPLIQIHPNAFSASRAAEAAGMQDKFWEMHDMLFETQNSWGQTSANQQSLFEQYAKELDLDVDKFKSDYAGQEVADKINFAVSTGKQFDITGTPTFVLNGKKIENLGSVESFSKALDKAIKDQGGTPPKTDDKD